MLEVIRLINFQCHQILQVEFDKHVTTIVGPSDIGKSAVLRALWWICFNKPSGDAFIRHESEGMSVRLWVDGHKIVRAKGKNKNYYKLDGQKFVAFGTDVPAPISQLLNVSEVNFQNQHDNPFWFSDTPGQVSRSLNQIINLGVIDDSLSKAASATRRAKVVADICDERLAKVVEQKKALDFVPELHRKLSKLEAKNDKIEKLRADCDGIRFLIEQVKQHKRDKRRREESRTKGQEIVSKGEKLIKLWGRVETLRETLICLATAKRRASIPIPNIGSIHSTAKDYIKLHSKVDDLADLIKQIRKLEAKEWEAHHQLTETEKKLRSVKVCPACGTRM